MSPLLRGWTMELDLEWALTAMWHKEKFEDDERGRLKIANGTRNLP